MSKEIKSILIVDDIWGWRNHHYGALRELLGEKVLIEGVSCAREAYDKVYDKMNEPYEVVITDLQMENDFEPDYAGEWLVKQIKLLSAYAKTKIIIVSAAYNVKFIADNLGVECIPKSVAAKFLSSYEIVREI